VKKSTTDWFGDDAPDPLSAAVVHVSGRLMEGILIYAPCFRNKAGIGTMEGRIAIEITIFNSRHLLEDGVAIVAITLLAGVAFEQAPRVDRPPPTLCFATLGSLPATQEQR
jgi:hypothetical protein